MLPTLRQKTAFPERYQFSSAKDKMWMESVEHYWNETGRGKPKYSEKHLPQCHFFHHISHMDCAGIEFEPSH